MALKQSSWGRSCGDGLFPTGLILYRAVPPGALKLDDLAGLCVSLMFVFAGILLGLPPEYTRWRSFLATLLITCFALAFDWVAFAPGERTFSGSFLGVGFTPGAVFGRALFGVFAVILDVCAVAMWIRLLTGRTEDRPREGHERLRTRPRADAGLKAKAQGPIAYYIFNSPTQRKMVI